MTNDEYVQVLLQKHYDEAHCGLVNKAPSLLRRGEAATANYYIFKIDICKSTVLLSSKNKSTYHKLAHIFLSTIDKITRDYGADPKQVEYAGDGITAYFSATADMAENVFYAAALCHKAANQIASLDQTLRTVRFQTKTVIHYAELTLANIGPWGDSRLTAIGYPLHRVSKIEKNIGGGVGRVTKEFAKQLNPKIRLKYLQPVYLEPSFKAPPISTIMNPQPAAPSRAVTFADLLRGGSQAPAVTPPIVKPERTLAGYDIRWVRLHRDMFEGV